MAIAAPVHKVKTRRPKSLNKRPSSYNRGYGGRRWDLARHRIFRRDNYICQGCGDLTILGSRDASRRPHCDHIKSRKQGGTDRDENLQTLCGSCHSVKSMRERML